MIAIAICKSAAGAASDALRAEHAAYVRGRGVLLCADLTAPAGEGGDYDAVTVWVAEGSIDQLLPTVAGDPAAGVWTRVEYYRSAALLGAWSPDHAAQFERMKDVLPQAEMLPPLPAAGRFAVLSTFGDKAVGEDQGLGHRRNSARLFPRLLVAAALEHEKTDGASPRVRPHRSIYLYQGADLADVRAMTGADPLTRDQLWSLRHFDVAGLAGSLSA